MRLRYGAVIALLALFLVACQATPTPLPTPTPTPTPEPAGFSVAESLAVAMAHIERPQGEAAAVVNGTPILSSVYLDFLRLRLRLITEQYEFDWSTEQGLSILKQVEQQVLEQLINATLERAAAEKDGLLPTTEELAAYKQNIINELLASGEYASWEEFKQRLELSEETFDRIVEQSLIEERMYERHSQVGDMEQVHVQHILVDDEQTAKDLLQRVRAGEDFATLAKAHSQDPGSAQNGGDLGWFPRGVMVPEFEEAAFALEPGAVSEVVATDYGYHIIKSLGKEVRPLDEAMAMEMQQRAFSAWLEALRAEATIERFILKSAG